MQAPQLEPHPNRILISSRSFGTVAATSLKVTSWQTHFFTGKGSVMAVVNLAKRRV